VNGSFIKVMCRKGSVALSGNQKSQYSATNTVLLSNATPVFCSISQICDFIGCSWISGVVTEYVYTVAVISSTSLISGFFDSWVMSDNGRHSLWWLQIMKLRRELSDMNVNG